MNAHLAYSCITLLILGGCGIGDKDIDFREETGGNGPRDLNGGTAGTGNTGSAGAGNTAGGGIAAAGSTAGNAGKAGAGSGTAGAGSTAGNAGKAGAGGAGGFAGSSGGDGPTNFIRVENATRIDPTSPGRLRFDIVSSQALYRLTCMSKTGLRRADGTNLQKTTPPCGEAYWNDSLYVPNDDRRCWDDGCDLVLCRMIDYVQADTNELILVEPGSLGGVGGTGPTAPPTGGQDAAGGYGATQAAAPHYTSRPSKGPYLYEFDYFTNSECEGTPLSSGPLLVDIE